MADTRQAPSATASRVVIAAWLLTAVYYFYQYMLRSAPAVMMPELTSAFGMTAVGIASLVGLFYWGYAPFSLIAGVAMDQVGPRAVVPLGAAFVAIGAVLFSTGDTTLASVGRFMKGGFTLSGGEPMMQDRFAARLLAAVKKMGVHTAIETNGYYGERLSDDEIRNIDLVILDMKAFTKTQHELVTGLGNADVLEFCNRLSELKRPMWFRYVLVPGLTDIPEEMEAVADFAMSLGVVERVEILPFHQMGRYKWERLNLDYKLEDTQSPSHEAVAKAVSIFTAAGLDAA